MNKIKKYIESFFKRTSINGKYDMPISVCHVFAEKGKSNLVDAIGDCFQYGYIKGYKAAMAEMKKGGAME